MISSLQAHSLEDLHAKYERGAYSQPPSGYSGFLRKTVAAMLHPGEYQCLCMSSDAVSHAAHEMPSLMTVCQAVTMRITARPMQTPRSVPVPGTCWCTRSCRRTRVSSKQAT